MSAQDFTRRMVVVVRKDIEPWQVTNAIGHIAAYLGNKLDQPFDTGDYFTTKDNVKYSRNSQYPIITKVANSSEELFSLFKKVNQSNLLRIAFIMQMIDHANDASLQEELSTKSSEGLDYLGVGIFGENDQVKSLTNQFKLFS